MSGRGVPCVTLSRASAFANRAAGNIPQEATAPFRRNSRRVFKSHLIRSAHPLSRTPLRQFDPNSPPAKETRCGLTLPSEWIQSTHGHLVCAFCSRFSAFPQFLSPTSLNKFPEAFVRSPGLPVPVFQPSVFTTGTTPAIVGP